MLYGRRSGQGIGHPALMQANAPPLRQGWLSKQPVSWSLSSGWRLRWVVLSRDACLRWWSDDEGGKPTVPSRGTFSLSPSTVVEHLAIGEPSERLVVHSTDGRNLALRGDHLGEWVIIISACVSKVRLHTRIANRRERARTRSDPQHPCVHARSFRRR